MENCLFVQWKKPTDASKYVIDGMPCEYSGTILQDKIMKLLAEVPQFKEICSNNGRGNLSPSFRCSYSTHGASVFHFIEGNFEDRDFADRNMVYIFMTSENDPIKAVETLKEYSTLLGLTLHNEDLEEITNLEFKKKSNFCLTTHFNNQFAKWTIIVIIVLLLLYTLLNLLSKQ